MKTAAEIFEEQSNKDFIGSGRLGGSASGLDQIPFVIRKSVCKVMEKYADQFKQKWISVDESMPEQDTPVLVFQPNEHDHLQLFVCSHDGSNWREYNLHNIKEDGIYEDLSWYDEITHWMSLPGQPN